MDTYRIRHAWQKFAETMRDLRVKQVATLRRFEERRRRQQVDQARKNLNEL